MQEAIDLQQAFDAQCASIEAEVRSGKPKRWPQATLTALDVCRRWSHYIRQYVAAENEAAIAEARKCFSFITAREDQLRDVFDGNADLRLAFDALRNVLSPEPVEGSKV